MDTVCDECGFVHEFTTEDFGGCAKCGGVVFESNTNGLCSDCVNDFVVNVLGMKGGN